MVVMLGGAGFAQTAPVATLPAEADKPAADTSDADLRALIPDSARANPEDWARQPPVPEKPPVATTPANTPQDTTPLSATSPLADLSGFTLDWPRPDLKLPPLESLPEESEALAALAAMEQKEAAAPILAEHVSPAVGKHGEVAHYTLEWSARIPEGAALETRFHELSALEQTATKDQELPQVAVRAITDRQTLERLLHIYGYYNAEVLQTSDAVAGADAPVVYEIIPGTRYRFGEIDTGHLTDAGADAPALRKALGIESGDPHADAIPEGSGKLDVALGEAGYPFAKIGAPHLTVDHQREEGDLTLEVTPEGKYRFGKIVSGDPRFLSPGHLQDIARFKPGQLYKRSEVDDFRRAMLATGLVSSITVTPRVETPSTPDAPGTVAMDIAMKPAPAHHFGRDRL
jgi:translocation and assembly module TamA